MMVHGFVKKNVKPENKFSHKVIVVCKCGSYMNPKALYQNENGLWRFWLCPECGNRR